MDCIVRTLGLYSAPAEESVRPGTSNLDRAEGSGLIADVWVVGHTVRTLKSDESEQTGLLSPTNSQVTISVRIA